MSITKEIEQEAAKIRLRLGFKDRVYAYCDGEQIVIKDRIYCNGGLQAMGTYHKDMTKKEVEQRLYGHITRLSLQGHIPSSLGRWSEVMRQDEA